MGIKLPDRHRQQQCARAAQDFQSIRFTHRDDADPRVKGNQKSTIDQRAIHPSGHSGFGQAETDARGDFENGKRLVVLAP
ncbi:hypothetical protein D3C73_1150440 [compost metagenome]